MGTLRLTSLARDDPLHANRNAFDHFFRNALGSFFVAAIDLFLDQNAFGPSTAFAFGAIIAMPEARELLLAHRNFFHFVYDLFDWLFVRYQLALMRHHILINNFFYHLAVLASLVVMMAGAQHFGGANKRYNPSERQNCR